MRRLCNVTYAYLAENRDSDSLVELNGQLEAEPGRPRRPGAIPQRPGDVQKLMAVFSMPTTKG